MIERSTSYEISLQSLCYKLDVEGLDYTLENYVDPGEFLAEDPDLAVAIERVKDAIALFTLLLDERREEYGIEVL